MVILSVAYPLAKVSRDAVGGAEQIVTALDHAITEAGHRSLVIASAGSRASGQLIPLPQVGGRYSADVMAKARAATRRTIMRVLHEHHVDVIHLHGVDFVHYLPETALPVFVTLHLPLSIYPAELFTQKRNLQLVCVSENQRGRLSTDLPIDVIPNGVDLASFAPLAGTSDEHEDYVAILGRVCPEKGVSCGLRAARLAGVSARLAGQVFPYAEHERYFDEAVLPLLDARRRFIGPVGGWAKRELLARARAVVVPSRIDETSSLTVMEALACGTPAIVTRQGALPELVEHGITGWHVDDVEDMAKAIARAPELSRTACREAAVTRFGIAEMALAYLARYERAARGEPWGRDTARRSDSPLRARA